jgi:ribosome maturation factor RimP
VLCAVRCKAVGYGHWENFEHGTMTCRNDYCMVETEHREKEIVSAVWGLVEPVIENEGLELVEIEYRRESHGWVLRLFIDHRDGITVEHCAQMSRVISDVLDVADPIANPYHLEVSSPGLDRPLRRMKHFQQQVGRIIELRTVEAIDNRRNFKGVLLTADGDRLTLDCNGRVYEIATGLIERARLRYFDSMERSR